MLRFRYSNWDGTQEPFAIDPDQVMDELSHDLMNDNSVWRTLQRLLQRGMTDSGGRRMEGYRDLLDRLKNRKQELTEKYDLGSILNDINERLQDIIDTERQGIDRRLDEARQEAGADPTKQSLMEMLENRASQHRETLDNLPPEPAGLVKELSDYDFMDSEARQKFQELMDQLKKQMMEQYFKDMQKALQGMTPQDMQAMKQMMRDLNEMLRQQMQGQPSGEQFQQFMQKYGQMFGDSPPSNVEELLEQMQDRMAQAQSLFDSMPEETRRQLQDLMESLVDDDMMSEMAQMQAMMDYLSPTDELRQRYPFSGEDELSMEEAMKLMDQLQQMDQLEGQLKGIQSPEDLEKIDEQKLEELLGEEARRAWEELKEMMRRLEEAGYIRRRGDKLELTPQGMRRIGLKAIRDIFSRLKKDRLGAHDTRYRGIGGEHTGETKQWEFGDEFAVDLQKSLMNSVFREGGGTPLRMAPQDFEVQRVEHTTQAATCLLLDRSRSMGYYGNWSAAKKVAIALHTLIKSKYSRDSLYIIGFSDVAVQFKDDDLAELNWDTRISGTNMHDAFMMSRKLLSKHKGSTRQIIMITDGEPTAHTERGVPYFSYPPSQRTISETLKEARRCCQEGVTINTFMLENSYHLLEFIGLMSRINGGRAFYSAPDKLGEYVLVDYLNNSRKRVA